MGICRRPREVVSLSTAPASRGRVEVFARGIGAAGRGGGVLSGISYTSRRLRLDLSASLTEWVVGFVNFPLTPLTRSLEGRVSFPDLVVREDGIRKKTRPRSGDVQNGNVSVSVSSGYSWEIDGIQ